MKAYRLLQWQRPPVLVDVEVPEPGPGEVLVRIGGAGACHSDISVMEWPAGELPYAVPFTLGHENAGWVARTGPGVDEVRDGDPVAVYGPWGCGSCRQCIQGNDTFCELWRRPGRARGGGLGRDGGMADFMLVPAARFLVPLRDLDPVEAAPLTDAGLTPYHAVKTSLHVLGPGTTAAVIGVGGLGHMAIQILRAVSAARVIAVDLAPERLELARRLGADHAVGSGTDSAVDVISANGGRKPELVLDFVGNDATLALAARLSRPRGRVVVVGIGGGTVGFGYGQVAQECEFMISMWGTLPELHEVIALAERGLLRAETTTFPLTRAADAYAALRAGTLLGRAVVTPSEYAPPAAPHLPPPARGGRTSDPYRPPSAERGEVQVGGLLG
jgi:alcohol dehydrogenase, propanol-preferring